MELRKRKLEDNSEQKVASFTHTNTLPILDPASVEYYSRTSMLGLLVYKSVAEAVAANVSDQNYSVDEVMQEIEGGAGKDKECGWRTFTPKKK